MNYTKSENTFKSSNDADSIAFYSYIPKEKTRAVIQISHGMCDYIERYEDFIDFLCKNGIAVFANDHLGHGKSSAKGKSFGFFADKNGYKFLSEDLNTVTMKAREAFPDKPVYLFGQELGSFVARQYMTSFPHAVDGVILSGTGMNNSFVDSARFFAFLTRLFKGKRYRSKFVNDILFDGYNKRIDNPVSPFEWLTKDTEVVKKYELDTKCNFIFTASGFSDYCKLISKVSSSEWFQKVPGDMPVYIVSGGDDPVSAYGKYTNRVFKKLSRKKDADISMKIFEGDRNEILNEKDKDIVYQNILEWLNIHIKSFSPIASPILEKQ